MCGHTITSQIAGLPYKHYGPPAFDPTWTWATCPANLAPSTEDVKHIHPSPPHTDSDPKHTVPLPTLSENLPSHAKDTSACPYSHPPTLLCPPTLLVQVLEGSFMSHPSTQDLSLSPLTSLPMVPHTLPEATTSCCTLDRVVDTHADTDRSQTQPTMIHNRRLPLINLHLQIYSLRSLPCGIFLLTMTTHALLES